MKSIINQRFIDAAKNNQLNELESLLSQGANIHTNNDWHFKNAADKGQYDIVKFLAVFLC